ncbi:MAG: ribonuclease H family protein [Bacteroidales bacterium]|nr:ribonuclease H [Bacteroidales bacterium]MBR3609262.1 ribonuclease H family protein [Bacteroidales bacterium]
MAGKNKFYVVWQGLNPGIYCSWEECLLQVKGVQGAKYKGFETREEAETAFSEGAPSYSPRLKKEEPSKVLPADINCAVAVDASCMGNPGKMEYQGVWAADGGLIFRIGPFEDGTNNIGEFLAIVHALAWMEKYGVNYTIYSDSRNAMLWVANKKCKTKLERTGRNDIIFELIERAEKWLNTHSFRAKIVKWDTKAWGEIPADFGRK